MQSARPIADRPEEGQLAEGRCVLLLCLFFCPRPAMRPMMERGGTKEAALKWQNRNPAARRSDDNGSDVQYTLREAHSPPPESSRSSGGDENDAGLVMSCPVQELLVRRVLYSLSH